MVFLSSGEDQISEFALYQDSRQVRTGSADTFGSPHLPPAGELGRHRFQGLLDPDGISATRHAVPIDQQRSKGSEYSNGHLNVDS